MRFLLIIACLFVLNLSSQNVAINTTGVAPNPSAMLDISNTGKGLLIPRVSLMSTTDLVTIPAPATSLMVYNTNAGMLNGGTGFYFYNGVEWKPLNSQTTITASTFMPNQTLATVGSVATIFPGPFSTFTKKSASSNIEVALKTEIYVGDITGAAFRVFFEVRVDGISPAANSGIEIYKLDNNGGLININNYNYIDVHAIFTGLAAGAHTVEIWAWASAIFPAGSATNLDVNPSNAGPNSIIVKEFD